MQTFLPYEDFGVSASILDDRRLGKQVLEVLQIDNALENPDHGWHNHAAVRMWRGYRHALLVYGVIMHAEVPRRFKVDGTPFKRRKDGKELELRLAKLKLRGSVVERPFWLGDPKFHAAHRSNLLRKKPEHYSQFGWSEPDNLPYVWPV